MRASSLLIALFLLMSACGGGASPEDAPDLEVEDSAPDAAPDLEVEDAADDADGAPDLAPDMDPAQRCPIARATGVEQGRPLAEPSGLVQSIPLKTIQLSALGSEAREGALARFEWELISAPYGSTAQIAPSSSVAEPRLFLDLSGVYEAQLRVFDDAGRESCEPARVQIVAGCRCGIHVQVVWHSLNDPDRQDESNAQMEVRYAAPGARRWDEEGLVLSSPTQELDWGQAGYHEDDPSMDSDGAASPVININHEPTGEGTYRLGVWHKDDRGFGPAWVTVRVYISAQLRASRELMLEPGDFVDVGDLVGAEHSFVERGQVAQGVPELIAP